MAYKLQSRRRDSPTPFYVLAGLIFVAIVGVGSVTFRRLGGSNDGDGYVTPITTVGTQAQSPVQAKVLNVEEVKGLAAAEAPHTDISDVALQQQNGQLVYVVGLASGAQLTFDARTGESLPKAQEDQPATPKETATDKPETPAATTTPTNPPSDTPADTPSTTPTPSEPTPTNSQQATPQTP